MKILRKIALVLLFLFSINLIQPTTEIYATVNSDEVVDGIKIGSELEVIQNELINNAEEEEKDINNEEFIIEENVDLKTDIVTTADESIVIKVDSPVTSHKLTGSFFIKGWAIGMSKITDVKVYVDNMLYGQATYGIERKDVNSKYPQYPSSLNSGFNMEVIGFKDGDHTVKVIATDINGEKAESSVNIFVDNSTTSIMSKGTLRREQMISYLIKKNPSKSQEYVERFIDFILEESAIEGVNADILFSQIMHETGFLKFGGDVKEEQNNFAGLGATGNGVSGESFPSIQIGIRAVVQHLKAYASTEPLILECVDTRFKYVERGSALYVEHLGIQENPKGKGWAASYGYGYKILKIRNEVKEEEIKFSSKVVSFETTGDKVVGSNMTMIAKGTPEADTEYRFLVRDPSGYWKGLNEYSSKNSIEYTPTMVGSYRYVVHVKHKKSKADYDELRTIDFNVSESTTSKVVSFETTGDKVVGSNMTMIAKGTPEADTEYRFLVRDPSGYWKGLNEYSSKNSIEYTPTMVGSYRYVVHVKHKKSKADYDELRTIDFNVSESTTSKVVSFETTGDKVVGSNMTMIAKGTPEADTEYRFLVRDPSGYWKGLNEYSSKNSIEYTPTMVGSYRYVVHVKHKKSKADYDELRTIDFNVSESTTSKVVSFETTGDKVVGSNMTMIAKGTPEADTEYRFLVRDPSGYWKGLNEYSSKNSIEYTPTMVGSYRYVVHVKHKKSKADYDELRTIDFNVSESTTSKVVSFETTGDKVVGSNMTMIAKGTPEADTEYRFLVRDPSGYWKGLNEYSSKNSIEYTPTMVGSYRYVVHVKHKKSKADYDELRTIDFNVSFKESTVRSFEISGDRKTGSILTLTANASPQDFSLYRFWLKDPNGRWITIQEFSESNSTSYIPKEPGNYRFVVHVKNKYSTNEYDELKYIDLQIVGETIKKVIVVDPGHNYGGDDGAYATHNNITYIERDLNMQVSLKLKSELEARGFKIVLTREPEDRETLSVKESLIKRVNIANSINADFFISIHHNTSVYSSAKGLEIYYSDATPGSKGLLVNNGVELSLSRLKIDKANETPKVTKSKQIGTGIVNSVTSEMGIVNRGLKNEDYYVVKNTTMPSLLVECGFITNPDEAKNLANQEKQKQMARIIAREIEKNL